VIGAREWMVFNRWIEGYPVYSLYAYNTCNPVVNFLLFHSTIWSQEKNLSLLLFIFVFETLSVSGFHRFLELVLFL